MKLKKHPVSFVEFLVCVFWFVLALAFVMTIAAFAAELPVFASTLRWFAGTCLFFLVFDLLIEASRYMGAIRKAAEPKEDWSFRGQGGQTCDNCMKEIKPGESFIVEKICGKCFVRVDR